MDAAFSRRVGRGLKSACVFSQGSFALGDEFVSGNGAGPQLIQGVAEVGLRGQARQALPNHRVV